MIRTVKYNSKTYLVRIKSSPFLSSQVYLTIIDQETGKQLSIKGIRMSQMQVYYMIDNLVKGYKTKVDEMLNDIAERFALQIKVYEARNPQPDQFYPEIILNPQS